MPHNFPENVVEVLQNVPLISKELPRDNSDRFNIIEQMYL